MIEPAFRGLGIDLEWFADDYNTKRLSQLNKVLINSSEVNVNIIK